MVGGEVRMARVWMAAVVVVSAAAAVGCVSDRKYQEALSEADVAKTELATTRAQKSALEQQVKTLKELNVKFSNDAQAAHHSTMDNLNIIFTSCCVGSSLCQPDRMRTRVYLYDL